MGPCLYNPEVRQWLWLRISGDKRHSNNAQRFDLVFEFTQEVGD